MPSQSENAAADRLRQLSADPDCARYLVGYLLAGTPPRWWPDLVQSALEYREAVTAPPSGLLVLLVEERFKRP